MKSKSIEHFGIIEGIKGDRNISVCYDGQDHIYLVNGAGLNYRIDRFNIKTMKFESYHQLPFGYDTTNKRFIKYNVETKQSINLNAISLTNLQFSCVMYHRESPTSSYIFSFGNSLEYNFKYSIESNQYEPFFRDIINHKRYWCASTSITF
ncbi:hypothetical protein PPL_04950 [Heterostelium album PN500]|uniref:Uncharacterized protein n=1 Tax=Heterostelium pallidum (strain ATCC 26659 / Pp 5 / PN500) TaxID=670386 RepID=D3B906_HETP5|nr:hypothetical protein PPL_04950 [Heterostelium album PN500]EFA82045.1 hypothetical protein PPL_04950 [Heterostelium album PN500]|eukprot:XP_020434162.1 hypothetical protein PPL_04950 [Heterostelium album PN500]